MTCEHKSAHEYGRESSTFLWCPRCGAIMLSPQWPIHPPREWHIPKDSKRIERLLAQKAEVADFLRDCKRHFGEWVSLKDATDAERKLRLEP